MEETVFTNHYAKLCSTLTDVDSLLPHFVEKRIINTDTLEEIITSNTTRKKVQRLLLHIKGPLECGNTEAFYNMLTIMEEHGHQTTQQLANQMRKSINNY